MEARAVGVGVDRIRKVGAGDVAAIRTGRLAGAALCALGFIAATAWGNGQVQGQQPLEQWMRPPVPAPAEPPPSNSVVCVNEARFREVVEANKHGAKLYRAFEGEQAERFVAAFNAREPVTSFEAEAVQVYVAPREPFALVAFFTGGCYQYWGQVDAPTLTMLVEAAEAKEPGVEL